MNGQSIDIEQISVVFEQTSVVSRIWNCIVCWCSSILVFIFVFQLFLPLGFDASGKGEQMSQKKSMMRQYNLERLPSIRHTFKLHLCRWWWEPISLFLYLWLHTVLVILAIENDPAGDRYSELFKISIQRFLVAWINFRSEISDAKTHTFWIFF